MDYQGNMVENNAYEQGVSGQESPADQRYYGGLKKEYTVDMVFCIDATGSMEHVKKDGTKKIINMVKENALNFYSDLTRKMEEKRKKIAQLRVRIIAFRDYKADKEDAMLVTDFFNLPEQKIEFEECINSIHAKGGGDIPEDGLEALAYAMKSNWNDSGADQRQVIVVWTDAPTHALRYAENSPYYPQGMPADLAGLGDWWDEIPMRSKRLVLYAPPEKYWDYIADNWDNVVHYPSIAGNGLSEFDYSSILDMLVQSITQ